MEDIIHSILRTFASYILLLVASVWIGKQMNSHINHYNLALSVTLGSLVANMGFATTLKFIPMVCAFLTLIFLYILVSLISANNRNLRTWFSGEPTVLVESGKILDGNMKKIRYSLDDLNQQLREQGIFDVFQVEYALLEVSGKLSVLKKPEYQSATKEDIQPGSLPKNTKQPKELVMDGQIIEKNLNGNYSMSWLEKELSSRNLHISEIQYAIISSNGKLFIDLYNDHLESPIDVE